MYGVCFCVSRAVSFWVVVVEVMSPNTVRNQSVQRAKLVKKSVSWEDRAAKRRGGTTVSCQVSDRYLKFSEIGADEVGFGHPLVIEVMTEAGESDDPRKICEMVVSWENLEWMLSKLRKDFSS